jgi:hypothetical protein
MEERRKLKRFCFEVPARIKVAGSAEAQDMLDLATSNICSGGAFFRTMQTFPEGTKVMVDLILHLDRLKELTGHTRSIVRLNGTIARSGSTGMAIRFDEDCEMMPLESESAEIDIGTISSNLP